MKFPSSKIDADNYVHYYFNSNIFVPKVNI